MNVRQEASKSLCIRRCARPIEIRNGHSRVVLCVHGFTGYPGEMAYPASRFAEAGWDVSVPRLSGHGTDAEDFMRAEFDDWRRQLSDEWLNLSSRYDAVRVLGHSMGGLLTLDLALRHPIKSAVLMAPAIGIRFPGQNLLRFLAIISPRRPYDWKSDPEYVFFDDRDDDDEAYLGREYWSWIWLKKLSGLISLQKEVEKRLEEIRTPILGLFPENDSVVGNRGVGILKKSLGNLLTEVQLAGCRHYIPYDPNPGSKEEAMDAVLNWLERGEIA